MKEAQSHASEDEARRELIDARNQADSLAYQVEKTVTEHREKVPAADLARIEEAIAGARKALQGDDLAAIKAAVDVLQRASHGLAEQLSKASQSAPGSHGTQESQGPQSATVKEGEVVDAR